jgi:TonB family protein
VIRAQGALNGGGEALHLKAVSGNIVLKVLDLRGGRNRETRAAGGQTTPAAMSGNSEPTAVQAWNFNNNDEAAGFFDEVRRRILESWWGAVPVDADELQHHLEHSVAPAYPEVARAAGIEGDVALRVYVSGEGRVTDVRVLDGPAILARAAVEAVRQWQYQSPAINGRPTSVVTTLVVSFRLK